MPRTREASLSHVFKRQIAQRAYGRIHRLAVVVGDDRVTVRGQAPSYYIKQLAIQACLEVLERHRPLTLEVDIAVGESEAALAT